MISYAEAKDIFKMMFYIRYVEESIASEYEKGYIKCPVHLYIGQEAIATGVCMNLSKTDYITTNHRNHGHYLAKGGDLRLLLEEIWGLSTGCTKGWGGSQHPYAPEVGVLGVSTIVGGGIAIGTGIALALKMKKSRSISVVFFGDGATDEGYFYESLNFSSLKKLPVLYICENNFIATHSRIEKRRAPNVEIYKIAQSLGVKSNKLDGNTVISIYTAVKKIVNTMRESPQPYLLELTTYRWKGHVSPDEDYGDRYRTKAELEEWKNCCPIKIFEEFCIKNSILTDNDIETLKKGIISYVGRLFVELKAIGENRRADLVPSTPY